MIGQLKAAKYSLGYIGTDLMAADIFTKFYPQRKKDTWSKVCRLICIYPKEPDHLLDFGRAGHGHAAAVARMTNEEINAEKTMQFFNVDDDEHPYLTGYNPFCELSEQGESAIPKY